MKEPAPYSHTDAAEQAAYATFLAAIDPRFVKADIRTRDKFPNFDGVVELVDQRGIPSGKLDVQLRSMPPGQESSRCEASLVAYSAVSTLPVLLICADPVNHRVFWRQITQLMPEVKEGKDSFTVRFSPLSDVIDGSGVYIQKWTEIALDYQRRIAGFQTLQAELSDITTLESIPRADRTFFQHFIDRVNDLLDNDFVSVKSLLYQNAWKLGVGILASTPERLWYQIYRIPYGAPLPLVRCLSSSLSSTRRHSDNALAEYSSSREWLADPRNAADRFVFDRVVETVQHRALPLHGSLLAADLLTSFVDDYYRCLGIPPGQGEYHLEELDYAFNTHLLGTCVAVAARLAPDAGGYLPIDLDWLSTYLEHNRVEPILPSKAPVRFELTSSAVSIRAAVESLRYLVAHGPSSINRPFNPRQVPLPPGGHWIWEGFVQEEEVTCVTRILKACLDEYSTFVSGNSLRFPNSPYLDRQTAIVFVYQPADPARLSRGPTLSELHLRNPAGHLPKVTVFSRTDGPPPVEMTDHPIVRIAGEPFEATRSSLETASFFFRQTPVLNLIYRMLATDLAIHYDIGSIRLVS